MTVTQKLFKILSGHDVANGQMDGQTDGQMPYHNMSEVLLRAYKNENNVDFILLTHSSVGNMFVLLKRASKWLLIEAVAYFPLGLDVDTVFGSVPQTQLGQGVDEGPVSALLLRLVTVDGLAHICWHHQDHNRHAHHWLTTHNTHVSRGRGWLIQPACPPVADNTQYTRVKG